MKKAGEILIYVGGVAFLVLCGAIYWQEYRTTSILSSRGVVVDATLDDTYTENLRNHIPESYTVTYRFVVGNQSYSGTSKVKTRPDNKTVKVAYDPRNPPTNQVVGSENFYDSIGVLFAALIIGLGLALIRLLWFKFRNALGG